MLSVEETLSLIACAQQGDNEAKEKLVTENLPLVKSIVRRFKGRLEYDDLMQLGAMGFIKAVMGFDSSYGVRFSTYAVPMITGEIKRFLRDDGAVKVSRWAKTLSGKIAAYLSESGDEDGTPLGDRIAGGETPEEGIDGLMLRDSIMELPEREKKIIILRYFRDKTQSEVAGELGVSQVQVSRLENKILQKIRDKIS